MPSKLDLLREGHAIEFEPGLSGRLNKQDKTLELSNGRVLNVENDRDYFPQNPSQMKMSKQREYSERGAKGPVREFIHQYTSSGIPKGISDWPSYLTQTGEDYAQRNAANAEVSNRISKESPFLSGAATAANIGTDLALTRGMSALKAAPLLTLGSAGSRLVTDPENVAIETGIAAAGGKLLDAGGNWASKVAQRRAASRALPGQQQAVREANEFQTHQHNFLKENVKNHNEIQLQKYQQDLNSRQNKIIQNENDFSQKKVAREAEIVRLKNKAEMDKIQRNASMKQSEANYKAELQEWKNEEKRLNDQFNLEKKQYEQDLQRLPELQKKAQQEYSAEVVKNAEEIANAFPKGSRIYSSQLGSSQFIEDSIQKSGLAGSREANQATRILKSLFPEGEILTSKDLASRYKSLEEAIQKSTPEVKQVLSEFKTHLGDRLPSILTDNMAYNRVIPSLRKQVEREVMSALDGMQLSEVGIASRSFLKNRATSNMNQLFREMTPQEFMQKMQRGQIRQEILKGVLNSNDFASGGLSSLKPGRKAMSISSEELQRLGINVPNPSQSKYDEFSNLFMNRLDKALAKAERKIIATDVDASTKLGGKVRKTYGTAKNVNSPNSPTAPSPSSPPLSPSELPPLNPINLPPPVQPPLTPPMPGKPQLAGMPQAPTPILEPTLPAAQGFAERTGDLMEKNLLGGKGIANNPLTKLAGLKYLLGSAALPAEAAYVATNILTSPGALGEVSRLTFKQGGIRAIENWAQKYPSYNNGILENPQERRSLTKEIEDDSEIPIEQKAVIQSKINRGKRLQDNL